MKNIMHPNSFKMSNKPYKNLAIQNAGEDMNQCELSSMFGGMQNVWPHWQKLKKLNIILPYSPVIIFLGIYPIELKTYVPTKICTQMLIVALFIITKN